MSSPMQKFFYTANALNKLREGMPRLVQVNSIVSDADQGGVDPAGVHGRSYVVNNWDGVTAYVGAAAPAVPQDGDIAEYRDDVGGGGYIRVLANVGGAPPTDTKVVVGTAALAGSMAGQGNRIGTYDGSAWVFVAPVDGWTVRVIGEETVFENEAFVWDAVAGTWVQFTRSSWTLSNTVFCDPAGSDTTGDGSIENPYQTIGTAFAAAGAGDNVLCGPGAYAEQLVVNKSITIEEVVRGSVTITSATAAGATVQVVGAGAGAAIVCRLILGIANTNNGGAVDIALHIDNTGTTMEGTVEVDGDLNGEATGTAIRVDGDPTQAEAMSVTVRGNRTVTGGIIWQGFNADEALIFDSITFAGGAAAWLTMTGAANTAGNVILGNCLMVAAAAGETIDFGAGAALGATLNLGSTVLAATLDLNNNAGAGIVVMTAGSQLGNVTATLTGFIHRWYGSNELGVTMYAIDANNIAVNNMYTVPAGRRFAPHTARTHNQTQATGGALNYKIDGTGVGSIVAAVGAGVVALGIVNETVVQDSCAPAAVIEYDVTAASGQAGDLVNAEVVGYLY